MHCDGWHGVACALGGAQPRHTLSCHQGRFTRAV
jgi:hypothetical protein